MHQHARMQIVDPEIFSAAVTQALDRFQRLLLRLWLGQRAFAREVVVVSQQAVGSFHNLPHVILSLFQYQFSFRNQK